MTSWTPAEDDHLRALHATETPVRKIAATLGRPRSTVAERLKKLGLSSTRTKTAAATQANIQDARARRAAAALAELEILELAQARTLTAMRSNGPWSTVLRGELGIEEAKDLPFVPPRDLREESASRSAMARTLDALTADDDATASTVSMLDKLATSLGLHQAGNLETPETRTAP